jgi:diguanylate cyclase (GGDEF)-like protein
MAILAPLCLMAIVWSATGLPNERVDAGLMVLSIAIVILATHLRISLPNSKLQLSLSDAVVMFSLIYFGGEMAVVMAAVSAFSSGILDNSANRLTFTRRLINIEIAIVTVFGTAVAVLALFGSTESIVVHLPKTSFIILIAVVAGVPFVVNWLLMSAYLAIQGESRYWWTLKSYGDDAFLVYFCAAIIAGPSVMALRETNIFLSFVLLGFFIIVQLVFRRYHRDRVESEKHAEFAESQRVRLAEKHVAELKHYIGELEKKSYALRESREKYKHAAYHDPLTNLPNRNKFVESINQLLSRSRTNDQCFALIYLDLHRFKTINDSLGHAMGDRLIAQVASRLSELIEKGEMIGRFGGDEFAILLPRIERIDEATEFANRVVEALSQPFALNQRQVYTGVSIGIAIGSSRYSTAGDLLRDADIAMHRAKERKRSIVLFEDTMHVQAVSLLQLETDLRLAIERNEFELFFQPIVELQSTRFCGVEALVRWAHPELGQISPDGFIEVSESTGLIIPMTLQILESACLQLTEWNESADTTEPIFVSVNLSGKHFNRPDVVEDISGILMKTGVDPNCVKLEITETAVMENAERAATVLRRIKDLGVQLSIDDFGTGYSSLSYLQRFPIDTLKIDRAFVGSMEDGQQNGEIVRAILALADAMDLAVIAEGIESVHQLHQLRIMNCRYGQGYLFSHPLPPSEIRALMRNPRRWANLVPETAITIVPPPVTLEDRVC